MNTPLIRLIAFYLPQYHPIPENDAWWEPGFTEWTNVTKAAPLFRGHVQPRLPADLGFYDLRLADARQAQADLAVEYGVSGFCYYHYWFGGKRLLERPFDEVLRSGEPKLPFCLCWANESWSRRWLGEEQDILVRQIYSPDDDLRHARWLARAFADPRYIRVKHRPMFLVYRPNDIPDSRRTTETIRIECLRAGIPDPYIVGVDAHSPGEDFRKKGFDTTLVFEPQLGVLPDFKADGWTLGKLKRNVRHGIFSARFKIFDYEAARALMTKCQRAFPHIRSVFVGWDNTPRRGRDAIVVMNSSPDAFERALQNTVSAAIHEEPDEAVVFVNAWNEWAEGNHLEPCQQFGLQYLERVNKVLTGNVSGQETRASDSVLA